MVSHIFQVKIVVYSIFEKNSVLFSSIFNSQYKKKIQLIAVVENEEIFYGAVFDKECLEKLQLSEIIVEDDQMTPRKLKNLTKVHIE